MCLAPTRRTSRLTASLSAAVLVATLPLAAPAAVITVDEIIYEDSAELVDASLLEGTVEMSLSGSTLQIVLTNISAAGAGLPGSAAILTGVGFHLPTGVTIGSGLASLAGATIVNDATPADGNVSGEWGYDNDITRGPFMDVAQSVVNSAVTAMVSSTDQPFDPVPLFQPGPLAGPEMGLVSQAGDPGGLRAIRSSVTIDLQLTGAVPTNLLELIEAGDVVVSFGSPNASVPEPAVLALLGGSLLLLGLRRRRRD